MRDVWGIVTNSTDHCCWHTERQTHFQQHLMSMMYHTDVMHREVIWFVPHTLSSLSSWCVSLFVNKANTWENEHIITFSFEHVLVFHLCVDTLCMISLWKLCSVNEIRLVSFFFTFVHWWVLVLPPVLHNLQPVFISYCDEDGTEYNLKWSNTQLGCFTYHYYFFF